MDIKMENVALFTDGSGEAFVSAAAAAHVDAQALDFLIERGQRNHEALGGFGLIPTRALEHVDDDAALDFIHDREKRGLRMIGGGTRTGIAGHGRKKLGELETHAADDFLAADAFRE